MPGFFRSPRPLLAVLLLSSLAASAQQTSSVANDGFFPGIPAHKTDVPFEGIQPVPNAKEPLSSPPTVLSLDQVEAAQMSPQDTEVVSNLQAELSKQAALAQFDISRPGWNYQQVVCPALPDYVLLTFRHGADPDGSSRFGALLPRDGNQVRVLTTYSHGLLPFEASWNRPGSLEVFNAALRHERGMTSLRLAPNWLMIGMCFTQLTGYGVQVLNAVPDPGATLTVLRLGANQPQMVLSGDGSADVTFSDVSRPGTTARWDLHFDRNGQMTSAGKRMVQQPARIALKP